MTDYSFTSFKKEYYSDNSQSTHQNPLARDSKISSNDIEQSNIAAKLEHC
jgi:hypothetical protein